MLLKNKKGFTLIELLVVIAIIGILSSVVLSSLSTSRTKALDAKVQSQLSAIRDAAELYNITNGNYGAATNSCTGGMFADTASGLAGLTTPVVASATSSIECNSSGTAYAVSEAMSASSTYWCVDNTGASGEETAALGTGVVCP
jgi:prepilin-type N-terminal cleavage/methylation domain-containing protein